MIHTNRAVRAVGLRPSLSLFLRHTQQRALYIYFAAACVVAETKPKDSDVSVGDQSSNSMERRKKDVGALRGYLQLLDQYSLHHFIIYKVTPQHQAPRGNPLVRTGALS